MKNPNYIRESDLVPGALYQTPVNSGNSWLHNLTFITANGRGTKYYFLDGDRQWELTRLQVRKLRPVSPPTNAAVWDFLYYPGLFPVVPRGY